MSATDACRALHCLAGIVVCGAMPSMTVPDAGSRRHEDPGCPAPDEHVPSGSMSVGPSSGHQTMPVTSRPLVGMHAAALPFTTVRHA